MGILDIPVVVCRVAGEYAQRITQSVTFYFEPITLLMFGKRLDLN